MRYLSGDVDDVVLATDFTDHARRAFEAAVKIARTFGARLHILHVNEEELYVGGHDSKELTRFLEGVGRKRLEWLEALESEAKDAGLEVVPATRQGEASGGIIGYAEEVDADLVVLGQVGVRGIRRLLTGSTAKAVLRHLHRPVLVVSSFVTEPLPLDGPFRHVLYPTDGSPASRRGLEVAEEIVRRSDARLSLLHVLKLPTIVPSIPGEPPLVFPGGAVEGLGEKLRADLDRIAAEVRGVDVQTLIEIHGDPAEAIAEVAEREGCDLVVLPRHSGHISVSGLFFGRTSGNVARIASVPVLVFDPTDGEAKTMAEAHDLSPADLPREAPGEPEPTGA